MPSATERGYPRETGPGSTLERTLREFKEDNLTDWAAALTYYGVMSLFPALIALVSIAGLVLDPREITRVLTETIAAVGPQSAVQTFQGPLESITASNGKAGLMLIVGVLAALWSASGYVGAFMRASNVVYEVDEGREFYKLRPLQMVVTLAMILLIAVGAVAVIVTGPLAEAVGSAIGLGDTAVTIFGIVKWPLLAVMVMFMISLLYYAAPNAKLPSFKFITPGGVVAVVIWVAASAAFAFYVANFGSYDKTYGSLAGVVLFLVWLWISNIAILLGAELNAERERDRQFERGVEGAERELRLGERDEPKAKQKPTTA